MSNADLLTRLRSHASFFDAKISLLPVQVYYPPDEAVEKPNKFMKHKGEQGKRTAKDKAIEAAEAQGERFSSFDPANLRTVALVQQQRAQQASSEAQEQSEESAADAMANKIAKKKLQKTASKKKEDKDESDEEPAAALPKKAAQDAERKLVVGARPVATASNTIGSTAGSVSDQLRARLQEKIVNMKQHRKSEQQEEAARCKAVRIAAEISAGTYVDHSNKQARNANEKKRKADSAGLPDRGQTVSKVAEPAVEAKAAPAEPKQGELNDVLFSSITLNPTKVSEARNKDKKKSNQKLLKKLENFQEKLQDVDEETKDEILQEKAVKAALLRAQGVKVIDDPKLLRRKLKREEKQKQKSAKVWKERIGAQHAETAKRQEGRAANVRERQQKIVAKRLKKNKKTRKD